jgi:hypothetical protein
MTKPNGYVVRDLHIILGLYVDNYIIIGNNIKFLEHTKAMLSSNFNLRLIDVGGFKHGKSKFKK